MVDALCLSTLPTLCIAKAKGLFYLTGSGQSGVVNTVSATLL